MKRSAIFTAVIVTVMMMVSGSVSAQGRGGNMGTNGGSMREMRVSGNGGMQMRGGNDMQMRGGRQEMGMRSDMGMRGGDRGMEMRGGSPRVDDKGFVPGWEGRVRYMDGRWGYLRGHDWYWYDTYYEPAFYFGHPLDYFPVCHMGGHRAGRIVAGMAGGMVLGAIIGALCR